MIAEHGEDAAPGPQFAERAGHGPDVSRRKSDVVPGQRNDVRLQPIGEVNRALHLFERREKAVVDVGEVNDPQAVEAREASEPDDGLGDLRIVHPGRPRRPGSALAQGKQGKAWTARSKRGRRTLFATAVLAAAVPRRPVGSPRPESGAARYHLAGDQPSPFPAARPPLSDCIHDQSRHTWN